MNRVAVITGASSGIGAEAARRLSDLGWEVAVVGRNPERTRAVADEVGGRAFLADYDRLDDVRALADALGTAYPHIDVLANNAGGLVPERALTEDGFERTIQHNHLAPFLLTQLLLPALQGSRILGTASIANLSGRLRVDDLNWEHRRWLGGWRAYGTSKIATIVFARALAAAGYEAYSFHPGYVTTSFGADSGMVKALNRMVGSRLQISVAEGAAPLVHLASVPDTGVRSGTYFDRLRPGGRVQRSADGTEEALWEASARMVGLR
ncbi:MAG TPA: SDR family NAD(P)-dependent oxidoreductase [Rhodoglobus sp.]|nr:SDR family NAD(P)-dependent oxidoreductase [Rhodoglobus sp.]